MASCPKEPSCLRCPRLPPRGPLSLPTLPSTTPHAATALGPPRRGERPRSKHGESGDLGIHGTVEALMKDSRTRLAHKFEQAVDMESGTVVAVTAQTMDGGDTASLPNTHWFRSPPTLSSP